MTSSEQFGIDPEAFADLERIGQSITHATDARKFSSTAIGMFGEIVYIELPSGSVAHTGETPQQAHERIQRERGF